MVPDFEPGSHYRGPLYRLPVVGAAAGGIPTPMLGVARRALDEVTDLARTKTPWPRGLLKERAGATPTGSSRSDPALRATVAARHADPSVAEMRRRRDPLAAAEGGPPARHGPRDAQRCPGGRPRMPHRRRNNSVPSYQPAGTLLPGCPDDETSCLRLSNVMERSGKFRGSTDFPWLRSNVFKSGRGSGGTRHRRRGRSSSSSGRCEGRWAGGLAAADEDGTDGWTARAKAGVGCPCLAEALSAVPVSVRAGGFADERRGELKRGICDRGTAREQGCGCPGAGRPRGPGSSLRLPRRSRRRRYGPRVLRPSDGDLDRTGAHQQRAVPVEGRTVETLESARPPIGASHQLALVRAAPPPGPAAEGGQRRPAASPVPTAGRRAGRPSTPSSPGGPPPPA